VLIVQGWPTTAASGAALYEVTISKSHVLLLCSEIDPHFVTYSCDSALNANIDSEHRTVMTDELLTELLRTTVTKRILRNRKLLKLLVREPRCDHPCKSLFKFKASKYLKYEDLEIFTF
jgi:hypothetical protein